MTDSRLNHLGSLLESKNRTVRHESANAIGNYSLCDEKVVEVLLKYLTSTSWDTRVSASHAVYSVLRRLQSQSLSKEEVLPADQQLKDLNIEHVIRTYKPLLSADSSSFGTTGNNLSTRQQRQIIDQHLDLQSATGISSTGFLSDAEVLPGSSGQSPKSQTEGEDLKIDVCDVKKEPSETSDCSEELALVKFTTRLIPLLADQRWNVRHGVAMAITKIMSSFYSRIPSWLVDNCGLRLIQVLVLDQFNDFLSGRNATAPVRETCAQAVGYLLHNADEERKEIVIKHVQSLLSASGEKLWHCRQSALLVLKYYFAVASVSPTFDVCFQMVLVSLNDTVDDVVSCAVSALSSLLSNQSVGSSRGTYVEQVMTSVWRLLRTEAAKEQLRSGLDALAIDLMSIVDTWLQVETEAALSREDFMTICGMIDAAYQARTQKIIALISLTVGRGEKVLDGKDIFSIFKSFFRVLLFSAPAEDTVLLELIYLTSLRFIERYREEIWSDESLRASIGSWINCLMLDHRNPMIDVFSFCVDGPASKADEPLERMCSEEMRFLSDRGKDDVYITRKILAAKFLASIIHSLYQSGVVQDGQAIALSLQLLFIPPLMSASLYQALGAAIIINEWAALYKSTLNSGSMLDPPITLISNCDACLRTSARNFDELTSSVTQLTQDCNEFVDYCALRGLDRASLNLEDSSSVEDISRSVYEQCRSALKSEKQLEALDSRYKLLTEWIQFTKVAVRCNSTRVSAFLSSALFYFGYAPEKLTPMVRPLVECMQVEDNDTVAAEVFKGSVPLMVVFSWPRTPKPYVKVIAKAMDIFPSCSIRIPKAEECKNKSTEILSLSKIEEGLRKPSAPSRNAEMLLLVCSSFAVEQLPEFYEYFGVDECSEENLLCRLELHGCLWSRVGSCLSDKSTERIINLLKDENPAKRFGGAKAVATFARSRLGDTVSRMYETIASMLTNINNSTERRGAVEVVLRLSYLGESLCGVVSLLAPLVFPRLADRLVEVREAAGEAFRNLVPLLALESSPDPLPGLSEALVKKRRENSDFIHVLSCPSQLPLVMSEQIAGLCNELKLRHYQQEGITWMRFMRRYGLNGILADDMGLGKTLQTMCTLILSLDQDSPKSRGSLVVCPRTLVEHWCNEWRRYFPGRPPARKVDMTGAWRKAELVVTAYEDLKNSPSLLHHTWNYVVLDEGHVMRNPKTAIWKAASELKATSRLILSGTPVQNSPADLWALFAWLMPGYLGDEKQFRAQFLKKILRCRSQKASEKEIQEGSRSVASLHKLILPFVLRRLKTEVLKELPDKNVQDYECELSDAQREIYKFIVDRCTANKVLLASGGIAPLSALISLRKLVDHPSLVADVLEKAGAGKELLDAARQARSGKMEALGELLNECGIGRGEDSVADNEDETGLTSAIEMEMPHRALIFCQWKSSVELVSHALTRGDFGSPVTHLILDSSIPPSGRQAVVDRFNSDRSIDVLILTTHIGGVGLNLIGADVVIFLDHDWNPMKDLQAIDRAHRLGQTRKVNVYRLITQGTVEQKVMSLHKFKMNTADALIGSENRSLQSMATDELLSMFTLEGDKSGTSSENGPIKKKRKADPSDAAAADGQWNLADMWDESQYEEQFDVKHFIAQAK